MAVGYEGYRNYDWVQDGTLNDDPLSATDANLKAYSEAFLEYADTSGSSPYKVSSAFFNGECGCSGGSGTGTYTFAYAANGSFSNTSGYDTAWHDRAVIVQPDAVYATQYFDECGQPLSRVVTNTDPSGSPTKTWATELVRDSGGRVTETHTPANITAYTHGTGAFTRSNGAGLVNVFGRVSGGAMDGFPESVQHKEGNTGTAYFDSWTSYASRSLTVGATTDERPMVTARRSYYGVAIAYNTGSTYDETTMSYAWWSGTSTNVLYIAPKQATTTNPVVSTATNGSNAATTMDRFIRKDATTAFSLAPDGIYTYTLFTSGQLTKQISDVKTNGSFVGGDDPNTDWGITETGSGSDRTTLYAYDAQGRMDTMTDPDGRVHKNYYSRLSDQRGVLVNWPMKTAAGGGTYFGPAGYSVSNQAGKSEFSGLIAIASSGSTAALTAWIDETTADPISAVTTGTLARMSTSILDSAGVRVNESRSYFLIPGSGAGSVGTNYDAVKYVYDDMGRKIRTEDATGTLTRTAFDELGRVFETYLGTDDTGFPGSTMAGSANMVKTSENEYDSGSAGGNSHLTKRTAFVENSTTDRRDTTYTYDFRGRVLLTTNPQAPHTLTSYDNLGRVIASAQYTSTGSITVGTTNPAAGGAQSDRVALTRSYYDELGRAFKTERYKITQANGTDADSIARLSWFDPAGRLIKVLGDGTHMKYRYDRLGRPTDTFNLAISDDTQYGHASASTAVWNTTSNQTSVAGDKVLEENHTAYESTDSDNVLMRTTVMRNLSDTTTTGELDTNADGLPLKVTAANVTGRVQIMALWYDDLDRTVDTVNYGTNGIVGNGSTATGTLDRSALSTPPSRSGITVIRNTNAYNEDGTLLSVEGPGRPGASFGVGGIITRFVYDGLGRKTQEIHNYDGTVSSGNPSGSAFNQTTAYGYAKGLKTSITAVMPSGGTNQVTTYIYGSTAGTPSSSVVTTNNRLRAVKYPDSSNGGTTLANINSNSADVVSYAYNAQGQQIYVKDQAGNVIETTYDTAGRESDRAATNVASGFDGVVQRISTVYLPRGSVDTVTQYSAPTSGTLRDQVQYAYDDWGNTASFAQDVDSAIGGSGRASFAVGYTYVHATPSNAAESVRRTVLSCPGGSDVNYGYVATAGWLDDAASRVTTLTVNAVGITGYSYLGAGLALGMTLTEPAAPGGISLDPFNRPSAVNWHSKTAAADVVDVAIAYDLDSNVVGITDNVNKNGSGQRNFDARVYMDDLSRVLRVEEGTYSGTISNRSRDEQWLDGSGNAKLDQVGNWLRRRLDLNGNGTFSDAGDEDQSSDTTFNDANETGSRSFSLGGSGTTSTYAHDAAGNMTDDGKDYTYGYDVFGRLRTVTSKAGGTPLVAEYRYNGLNFRIGWHYDVSNPSDPTKGPDGAVDSYDPWYYFCYTPNWQNVATFRDSDADPKERFIYHNAGVGGMGGSSYIDDMVCRNRDADTLWNSAADGVLEERRYLLQNWRHDVAAVISEGGLIVETVKYSAYGVPFALPAGDTNSRGIYDNTDVFTGSYDVRKDTDQDGTLSAADATWAGSIASGYQSLGRGVLSSPFVANRKGYAGYEGMTELLGAKSLVRNRVLDSDTGRWTRRDPLGYVDGMGLYEYTECRPIIAWDFDGLLARECGTDPNSPTTPPDPGQPVYTGNGNRVKCCGDCCMDSLQYYLSTGQFSARCSASFLDSCLRRETTKSNGTVTGGCLYGVSCVSSAAVAASTVSSSRCNIPPPSGPVSMPTWDPGRFLEPCGVNCGANDPGISTQECIGRCNNCCSSSGGSHGNEQQNCITWCLSNTVPPIPKSPIRLNPSPGDKPF